MGSRSGFDWSAATSFMSVNVCRYDAVSVFSSDRAGSKEYRSPAGPFNSHSGAQRPKASTVVTDDAVACGLGSLHPKPLFLISPLSCFAVTALQISIFSTPLHVITVQLHGGVCRALLLFHLLHALQRFLVIWIQAKRKQNISVFIKSAGIHKKNNNCLSTLMQCCTDPWLLDNHLQPPGNLPAFCAAHSHFDWQGRSVREQSPLHASVLGLYQKKRQQ